MIEVKLLAHTNADPYELAQHAAGVCYQPEMSVLGASKLNVKDRLFLKGHHTPLEHWFATFAVEGIAVSDITFGLHLTHPFYNSDQRSGRFCAKMFDNPDFEMINSCISDFWPKIRPEQKILIMNYITKGVGLYQSYMDRAEKLSVQWLKEDRVFASDKYIEANARKIAQEQMRMFISTIFPTALDYTVDLIALATMYRTAWTPGMKFAVSQMAKLIMEKYPRMAFLFEESDGSANDWGAEFLERRNDVIYAPFLDFIEIDKPSSVRASSETVFPVDQLFFQPEMMDNSIGSADLDIEVSVATMGQDQRHRTIHRGTPSFTRAFYVPPLVKELGLSASAFVLIGEWIKLCESGIPGSLRMAIAPYGAVVRYSKKCPLNALIHEQAKRLCWCAQEEIYNLARRFRKQVADQSMHSSLAWAFEPHCFATGECAEGERYCGRDISQREKGDYFPDRRI